MAYVMASYGSAFVVGPLIAGFAADALTANFMFAAVAAAGCSIAALSVSFVFLDSTSGSIATLAEPGPSEPNRQLVPFGSIYFLAPILLVFVFGFVYSGFDTTLALRVTDHFQWGAREVGYLFAIAGATTVISQLCLTPWLHKLMGDWRIIGASGLALASGLGALGFTQTGIGAVAGIVLATAGAATAVVCLQSVIAQTCKRSLRGAALGIGHSALTVARVLGPLWAGVCFGVLGPDWFYISGIAIVVAVVVLAPSLEWGGRGSAPRRIIEGAR
jgi:MFS transporter, DHA1 family, tetracycline resistance protein